MTGANQDYERERVVAIRAVREAARLCRAVGAEISPESLAKKDKSPVTVADFGSQALICRALAEAFPDDPIIAEEDSIELTRAANAPILDQVVRHVRAIRAQAGQGAEIDGDKPIGGEQVRSWIDRGGSRHYVERFWTLDPIDGTKGFLRGEQYAIALALIVEGRIVVAALACPNLPLREASEPNKGPSVDSPGAIFWAVAGKGAYEEADGVVLQTSSSVVSNRLIVSLRDVPAEARFCESVESGHSAHGDAAALAARLGIVAPPLRMDSQAKYAVVARGQADIYLRMPTRADYREKIWDHAAGALIVSEAGGTVTDINGRPLEFNQGRELAVNQGVIVSNGRLHRRVVQAVQPPAIAAESGGGVARGSVGAPPSPMDLPKG